MALAMQSNATAQDDIMDIDIDMDIDDVGPAMEDDMLEEGEEPSFQPSHQNPAGIIPAIYTEDPAQEPQWQKVYIHGVDDMHTSDILAFSKDHFPEAEPHIQWIDDSSANIVFENSQTARAALLAFVQNPITTESITNAPFEDRTAKQLASRPSSILVVRIAQVGDRKKKNARDASRYYLLHPDEDPAEKIRRDKSGRGENGDYKRRRFDEREHRRRRDHDHNPETEDFSAAMYDDAPSTTTTADNSRGRDLFSRITKSRRRSASPDADAMSDVSGEDDGRRRRRNGYRDRSNPPPYTRRDPHPHPRSNVGKELFSDPTKKSTGTLHSDRMDSAPSASTSSNPAVLTTEQRQTNSAAARRLKADLLASVSAQKPAPQTSPRNGGHRRSHAMDAKNDEDLAERFGRKSISMDSTKSLNAKTANSGVELFPVGNSNGNGNVGSGLNIRGSSLNDHNNVNNGLSIKGSGGFSIRGRAGAEQVKELFPDQYSRNGPGVAAGGKGTNKGKELFDEPVRRKGPRQRAGDLFD